MKEKYKLLQQVLEKDEEDRKKEQEQEMSNVHAVDNSQSKLQASDNHDYGQGAAAAYGGQQ